MERLSNNESDQLEIKKEWIDEAVEMVREGLERQLFREQEPFRVRMSNISKPTCQLHMEKQGKPKSRMPYNHIMRMMHGDMIEAIMQLILRISGANITGGKNKVKLDVAGTEVRGEDDIEIDHKVFDTKSASPWAFGNKWSKGFAGLQESDDFGYIGQLVGYSAAQNKEPGGWIVVDKSSGQVKVVEADLKKRDIKKILGNMSTAVKSRVALNPKMSCSAESLQVPNGYQPPVGFALFWGLVGLMLNTYHRRDLKLNNPVTIGTQSTRARNFNAHQDLERQEQRT